MEWFKVDKEGLAKLLERRGKQFILFELIQNALDENTNNVTVTLRRVDKKYVRLTVEDDSPDGFTDLSHAFTLFAESNKKGDAEKRGRFNLGEKLVLAMCTSAEIRSTKGGVRFDANGRHSINAKRKTGSVFEGDLEMTDAEVQYCAKAVKTLLIPESVNVTFNGQRIETRASRISVDATLPTEIADTEGRMRRTRRKTKVEFYDPQPNEKAMLYEMGIPVVETDDKYHVNVLQKLILNFDRDNVTPAFLSEIRALTVENLSEELTVEDANSPWVRDAFQTRGEDMDPETVRKLVGLRFGDKVVSYDLRDPEANGRAVAAGYTLVHGGQMSSTEWAAVRKAEAIRPAGQVMPSGRLDVGENFDGDATKKIPLEKWSLAMLRVALLAKRLAPPLIEIHDLRVQMVTDPHWRVQATYQKGGTLTFNVGVLGRRWFEGELAAIVDLIIHEFAHEDASNHLSDDYYNAITKVAGKAVALALDQPKVFDLYDYADPAQRSAA